MLMSRFSNSVFYASFLAMYSIATVVTAQESELAENHPSCAIGLLSDTVEYDDASGLQAWTKNLLLDKIVYCDEYAFTEQVPGGVRTNLRNRYRFDLNRLSLATIHTGGAVGTSITSYRYTADPEARIIALKDNGWYDPAIKTDSGYIFDLGGGYASCCYTLTEQPLRSLADAPLCIDDDGDGWGWDGVSSCRTEVSTTGEGDCDYTIASQHDGWGWNPVSGQSCPPLVEQTALDFCDYDLADSQEGWGWNEATGESCAPTEESLNTYVNVVGECDYQDARSNNGWGYNRVTGESCPPEE